MYTGEFSSINPNSIQTGGVQTWSFLGDLNNNGKAERNELGVLRSQFVPRCELDRSEPEGSEERRDHVRLSARAGDQLVVQHRLDPALVQRHDHGPELLRAAVRQVASTVYAPVAHRRPTPARTICAASGDDRQRDVLRRASRSSSARTRSSTPTAATTWRSTACSATRRWRCRSASGCRTAGRCRARTCGRASTATSRV